MASPTLSLLQYLRITAAALQEDTRTDAELLSRYANAHDEIAFTVLVARHGSFVACLCRQILGNAQDAEDAFQSTFLALSQQAGKIRIHKTLAGWLQQVAQRSALNLRAARATRQRLQEQLQTLVRPYTSLQYITEENETYTALHDELAGLTEKLRVPLLLHYFEGKTKVEVAHILGVSETAVRKRLERGRSILEQRLTQRGITAGAAALTAMLEGSTSQAAVSAGLIRRTVEAVLAFRAGKLSGATAELARQVLKSLPYGTGWLVKAGLVAFLCVGSLGAGAYIWRTATEPLSHLHGDGPLAALVQEKAPQKRDQDEVSKTRLDLYGDLLPPGALARLGTVRFRHPSQNWVVALVFTPDGKELITAVRDKPLRLWDRKTGRLIRQFGDSPQNQDQQRFYGGVALSPDGHLLAGKVIRGKKSCLQIWETATGKLVRQFEDHDSTSLSLCCAFSPDGKTVTAQRGDSLVLWEIATGRSLWAHKNIGLEMVAFSPDGTMVASGNRKNGVHLWDARTGRPLQPLGHPWPVSEYGRIAFSADSQMLLVSYYKETEDESRRSSVYLWNVATGKEHWHRESSTAHIRCPSFSPDTKMVATMDSTAEIRLWETATGKELRRCQSSTVLFTGLAFSPDGKVLATLTGRVIQYWEVASGKILDLPRLGGHEDDVCSIAFTPDGATLISAGDNTVRVWDVQTSQVRLTLPPGGKPSSISVSAAVSSNGKLIAAVHVDNNVQQEKHLRTGIRLWDAKTGNELRRFEMQSGDLSDPMFSPDDKALTATWWNSKDSVGSVCQWDVATGKLLLQRKFSSRAPMLFLNGTPLAWGDEDIKGDEQQTLNLWEATTGKKFISIPCKQGQQLIPHSAVFSPDGQTLAISVRSHATPTGTAFPAIYLYPVHRNTQGKVRLGEPRLITYPTFVSFNTLAFSRDGKMLAAAGRVNIGDKNHDIVYLWETASGKERTRFPGHDHWINRLAFAPDGRRLASGSSDTTILIWDVTGRLDNHGQLRAARLSIKQMQEPWADLAGTDATRANQSIWTLVAAGQSTVAFFAKQIRPIPPLAEATLKQLIADLDSETYAVRQKAQQKLEALGELAEPSLHQALEKQPSLELRRRVDNLLTLIEERRVTPSSEVLRSLRAIEVLEHIGTPEARQLLEKLSAGASGTRQTEEAKASLARLARRAAPK